jgi:hypothetical protein
VRFGASATDLLEAALDVLEWSHEGLPMTEQDADRIAEHRASIARARDRELWRPRPLGDIAVRINEHLQRFDKAERATLPPGAPPAADPASGRRVFRASFAHEIHRGLHHVRYDFTEAEYTLDAAVATRYLSWLDAGNGGSHLDVPDDFCAPHAKYEPS